MYFICLILMCSCSKINTAYDWAPRLAANYLDDNFDFSSERYDQVKSVITNDLKTNKALVRTEVLQHFDTALAAADKKDLTTEELQQFVDQMKKTQAKAVEAIKPTISEVVLNMKPDELAHLKKKTLKRWSLFEENLAEGEKYKKKSLEKFEENMEMLFNDVTDEQKKFFAEFVDENRTYVKFQLVQRQNFFQKFETKFNEKAEILDLTLKTYTNDDSIKTAEQKEAEKAALKRAIEVTRKIWSSLSSEQRQYFKKTLQEYRSEIEKLQ
jgi:hypothetical protein